MFHLFKVDIFFLLVKMFVVWPLLLSLFLLSVLSVPLLMEVLSDFIPGYCVTCNCELFVFCFVVVVFLLQYLLSLDPSPLNYRRASYL